MLVRSIRRITADRHHNAFTGACFFRGMLFVAYRQGDSHMCWEGKIIVLRSRDGGITFDNAAVFRAGGEIRDAHVYTDGARLFVVGIEVERDSSQPRGRRHFSGCVHSDDGYNWSPWTRYTGSDEHILWRPEFFAGRHYCIGYRHREPAPDKSIVSWFESDDGINWAKQVVVHEGADLPNECAICFRPDGEVIALQRREHKGMKPLLMTSRPPYNAWKKEQIDLPIQGPMLWLSDDRLYMCVRWYVSPGVAHTAVFELEGVEPKLQYVLPSGPEFDHSYAAVARDQNNPRRLVMSFYSNAIAPDDPALSQWALPDIYIAEMLLGGGWVDRWDVSPLQRNATLDEVRPLKPEDVDEGWVSRKPDPGVDPRNEGFVDVSDQIGREGGVVQFVREMDLGPVDRGVLHIGFDGPVRVWVNGSEVFRGVGRNPAIRDAKSLPVSLEHGRNRVVIALDTNGGKACGIYARFTLGAES